jgi:hypothetical protein
MLSGLIICENARLSPDVNTGQKNFIMQSPGSDLNLCEALADSTVWRSGQVTSQFRGHAPSPFTRIIEYP